MSPAPENDLNRLLTEQGDRFAREHGTVSMADVMSRAGEIRRGRRMKASMLMAAVVLAVAVPVGVTVLDDPGGAGRVPDPAETPTPTPVVVDNDPISLDGLEPGREPLFGYVDGTGIHTGAGSIDLPGAGRPTGAARITGGYLVARTDATGSVPGEVLFVGDDGTVLDQKWSQDGGVSFGVSPEGNVGAFVASGGDVVAVQDGGARYEVIDTVPAAESYSVVAVEGENCSGRSEGSDCRIWLDSGASNKTLVVAPNTEPETVTGFQRLNAINVDGDRAGMVSATDSGSCSTVRNREDTTIWETCDHTFGAYSEDGAHLFGGPAYLDGFSDGSLSVLDPRRQRSVLDLATTDQAGILDKVWEDPTHFLATVVQGNRVGVVRFDFNGNRELALPIGTLTDTESSPYVLIEH